MKPIISGETTIDTLDPSPGQIAVEEGRDGLVELRDLVVHVVVVMAAIGGRHLASVTRCKNCEGGCETIIYFNSSNSHRTKPVATTAQRIPSDQPLRAMLDNP